MFNQFFKSKKGEVPYGAKMVLTAAMGMVVGIGIVWMFIQVGRDYATGEIFDRLYLARDIALSIDSFYSVPGNALITYKEDLGDYILKIKDNFVILNPDTNTEGKYTYVSDRKKLDYYFPSSDTMLITKQGNELYITQGMEDFNDVISCLPDVVEINSLIIEPSEDLEVTTITDSGSENIVKESDFTTEIVRELSSRLYSGENAINTKVVSFKDGYDFNTFSRDIENYDYSLSINYGINDDFSKNDVIAYVNDNPKTRILACNILSSLMKRNIGITRTSIKTIAGDRVLGSDSKSMLKYGDNVIYLEIGNIKAKNEINLINRVYDVSEAIFDGIVDAKNEEPLLVKEEINEENKSIPIVGDK